MLRGAILVAASLLVLLLGAIGSAAPGEKKATVVAQENSGSYVGSAACARCHSAIYRSISGRDPLQTAAIGLSLCAARTHVARTYRPPGDLG